MLRSHPHCHLAQHDGGATPYNHPVSDTTTDGIRIEVESAYIPERSDPEHSSYFFAYRVRITNVGSETAQLLNREWIITDSEGNVERVSGPGVVGEQPILEPGESFEYTSFCPLPTSVGTMEGSYGMRRLAGAIFDARIDPFTLAVPGSVN
jgi:ApaG protein